MKLKQKIIGLQDTVSRYKDILYRLMDHPGPRMEAKYRRDLVFLMDKIKNQAKSLEDSVILKNAYQLRIQIQNRVFVIYSKFDTRDEIDDWVKVMNSILQEKITILEIKELKPYEEH